MKRPFDLWIDNYALGQFSADMAKPTEFDSDCHNRNQPPSDFADYVIRFYKERGFLPPIPSPSNYLEHEREVAIRRFGLDNPESWTGMQRCARLIAGLFKVAIAITIVHSDRVVVVATEGYPCEIGHVITYEESPCSHTILLQDGSLHQIPDKSKDWRFARLVGMSTSYFGQPVLLPARDGGPPLPVAVICLLDKQPQGYKTTEELSTLTDIAEMMAQQIIGTWQTQRRNKEEKMREFLSSFMTTAVLNQSKFTTPSKTNGKDNSTDPRPVIQHAAKNLRELLECDFVCFLDINALHLTSTSYEDGSSWNLGWIGKDRRGKYSQGGMQTNQLPHDHVKLLGFDISQSCQERYDPSAVFSSTSAMEALSAQLRHHAGQHEPAFHYSTQGTPLEAVLPPGTQSYISIPLFNGGQPDLIALISSQVPFGKFEPPDLTFASNVTLIIQSHLTRLKLLQADAAKTAFISVISHELRTPLHGLLCQLELLRETYGPERLPEVGHLLDTAECCGFALRDILNDVLEFGKMELSGEDSWEGSNAAHSPKKNASIDLVSLATEVLSISYGRRLQWCDVIGDVNSAISGVNINVVYEDRPFGWEAEVDVPGLRRVLFNLASNAIKYTPKGSITLHVREACPAQQDDQSGLVEFIMEDTGVGMSESFQQTLFTPFSQENTFNPGTGLGMSICQGIIRRMNGEIDVQSKLGVGTTVKVRLEVKFLRGRPRSASDDLPRTIVRKKISDGRMHHLVPLNQMTNAATSPPLSPLSPSSPTVLTKPFDASPVINHALSNVRVLVVDDNKIGRKALTTLLKKRQVPFAEAADGLEALNVYRTFRPNLVWTDVSMPIMDGIESARHMRGIERELGLVPARIVAITGLSTQKQMKEGLLGEAAIDEWLIKGQADLKTLSSGLDMFCKTQTHATCI